MTLLTGVAAQEGRGEVGAEIHCHSGSPLLLEIAVEDPKRELRELRFDSDAGKHRFLLPSERPEGQMKLRLSPFLTPGVRQATVDLRLEGDVASREYEIGFVDFVFGRDNFRFGNNADYESIIGTYSEILADWLEERFGEAAEAELVLLTDYMYSLFGENPGRCYAFSGSSLRYWRDPELLPSYYDSAYEIRQRVRRYQREMNYLQLDIVYNQFLLRPAAAGEPMEVDPGEPQSRGALLGEVKRIVERIGDGEPGAVGFIGPELHHSMLVYGYIHDYRGEYIDLLVANNWKSEEDLNLRSLDAERVRVFLEEEREESLIEWSNSDGPRKRQPNRLFLVEVNEEYDHPEEPLRRFLTARREELDEEGRALLVVENFREAWLTDGDEAVGGYKDRRIREELPGVLVDRVKRTVRFEYPRDRELWLELTDDEGGRILHLDGGEATVLAIGVPEEEEPQVQRRFLLRPGGAISEAPRREDE
ncbi:MAG: hypothetical protein ACLFNP_01320 [Spirochaetaceae bacterium]